MRAVFACTDGAYRQVGYWDVNGVTPIYGHSEDEELEVYRRARIVAWVVTLPEVAPATENIRFYHFYEGRDHNQLTLTDAREIYNMRKWIQRRGDNAFIELSCDEEAEHITEEAFKEPVNKAPVVSPKKEELEEELTDFDFRLIKDMKNR